VGFVSCNVEGENGIEGKGEAGEEARRWGSHPPLTAGNGSWQRKQCGLRCQLETLALGSVRWPTWLGSMCWRLAQAIGVWALHIDVGPEMLGLGPMHWCLAQVVRVGPYTLALGLRSRGWVQDVKVRTYALALSSRCLVCAVHVGVMLYTLVLGLRNRGWALCIGVGLETVSTCCHLARTIGVGRPTSPSAGTNAVEHSVKGGGEEAGFATSSGCGCQRKRRQMQSSMTTSRGNVTMWHSHPPLTCCWGG